MTDEAVAHLGDVEQTVAVDADVDERAEVGDVADGAGQGHSLFQILDVENVGAQKRRGGGVADVASGFLQLGNDVEQRRLAAAEFTAEFGEPVLFGLVFQQRQFALPHVVVRVAEEF